MNFHAKFLRTSELEILKRHFETVIFKNNYQMVFENQIPQVAMVLLSGAIHLKIKKKIIKIIDPGTLLGAFHLLNNHPVVFGCEISAQSEVLLIPKSELLEINSSHPSDPRKLILSA